MAEQLTLPFPEPRPLDVLNELLQRFIEHMRAWAEQRLAALRANDLPVNPLTLLISPLLVGGAA